MIRTRALLDVLSTLVLAVAGRSAVQPSAGVRAAHLPAPARGPLGGGRPIVLALGGDVHFEGVLRSKLDASPSRVPAPIAPVLRHGPRCSAHSHGSWSPWAQTWSSGATRRSSWEPDGCAPAWSPTRWGTSPSTRRATRRPARACSSSRSTDAVWTGTGGVPARIVGGVPSPVSKADRHAPLATWRGLGGCTGLRP